MNLIAYPFKLLSQFGLLFHFVSVESIRILLLSHLLLFISHLQCSQILLQLPFIDPILIFNILYRYLRFLLQLCQLVQILKQQVFRLLAVYFLLNLMPLLQIMELSLLVSEIGLSILELLLAD